MNSFEALAETYEVRFLRVSLLVEQLEHSLRENKLATFR